MNWQAKTRELLYNHRTSMDALGWRTLAAVVY